jgi:hypothetical protein
LRLMRPRTQTHKFHWHSILLHQTSSTMVAQSMSHQILMWILLVSSCFQ